MGFSTQRQIVVLIASLLLCGGAVAWLAGPRVAGLLIATLGVATPAAAGATLIGLMAALLIAKTDVPGRGFAYAVLAGLTLLPLHAVAAGWLAAFGDLGWYTTLTAGPGESAWLDGWRGAVWVHAMGATPCATLLIAAILQSIDPRREEQALLETGPWSVVMRVSAPQAGAGVAAAFVWAFVSCSAEIAVTDLFRVRTFAEEVYTQAALGAFDPGPGAASGRVALAMGSLLLAIVLLIGLLLLATLVRRRVESGPLAPWRLQLGGAKPMVLFGLVLLAVPVAGAPLGSLVYQAGAYSIENDEGWSRSWSAAKLVETVAAAPWQHRRELMASSVLGCSVATVAAFAGACGAWLMRRDGVRARLVMILIALLLATPGPVIGLVVIHTLNQSPDSALAWLGSLYGTWAAPLLAQTVRLAPVAAILLWPALATVPSTVLDAARTEGAGWMGRLTRVAVPMRRGAIVAVWVIVFALSLGELSATALVVPPGTPPLSVRLLSLLHYGVEDRVAAICLVLFLFQAAAGALAFGLLSGGSTGCKPQHGSLNYPE